MKRYYFRIYQNGDEDGNTIWVDARSEEDARDEVEYEYWGIDKLILMEIRDL